MSVELNQISIAIKNLAEREKMMDGWLMDRLENLLPLLMIKHGIDMWITIGREYNEDPIAYTLFPSSVDSSRRLTIFVFVNDKTKGIKRYVIHPNKDFEPFYTCYLCQPGEEPFDALKRIIDACENDKIAVNSSSSYAFCDGLSHTYHETLSELFDGVQRNKLVSSEQLAIDWLQIRTEAELKMYRELAEITRKICVSALSNDVITAGQTTTREVVDWIRQKVLDLGIKTSFYPTVDIQRRGASVERLNGLILPGDIIHLDFGIEYLGLSTDTQQLAYVLLENEEEPPQGLTDALKSANQFEDLFFATCQTGMTGNEIFHEVMKQAKQAGITAMLYSHPIGYHCHAAGPIIGLYDKQESIPVRGELPLQNDTCFAMEFNIRRYIPEWDQEVPIYLEESVSFQENMMHYLSKRQTEFLLIKSV